MLCATAGRGRTLFPLEIHGGNGKGSVAGSDSGRRLLLIWVLLAALACVGCGAEEASPPSYFEVVELSGTPYERGFQHGRRLAGKIRSLYTRWLAAGIIPWFNREQPEIAGVFVEYQKPLYDDGQFAYQALLQSGMNLLRDVPEPYLEELRGVSDGSGVEFERIVILNTFLDTLFGLRAVVFVIRNLQDPWVLRIEFQRFVEGEWRLAGRVLPYEPSPFAAITEIPTDARIRVVLRDPEGVDPDSLRVQLGRRVFFSGDPCLQTAVRGDDNERLEVILTPPEPLPRASLVMLQIQAGDLDFVDDPPPRHARVMRDERIAFTTEGYGVSEEQKHLIPNKGDEDERLQPTSISLAVRGSATSGGQVLAGHHFVGLDNDTVHKHGAVFIHRPDQGKPHVTVGLAGIIWGSSGMNSDGLVCCFNLSDTYDNPVTLEVLKGLVNAKLMASGLPIGILLREILAEAGTVEEARNLLKVAKITFGWNVLLADAGGSLAAVELDSNILGQADRGTYSYEPDDPAAPADPGNFDPWGRLWASVGPDDLRMAMHFQANSEDINLRLLDFPLLYPQRYWTTYYFRSLRSFTRLGEEIEAAYGRLDVPEVMRILSRADLSDQRNSMNAAVFSPGDLRLWYAMGQVPATAGPFLPLDFGAIIGKR